MGEYVSKLASKVRREHTIPFGIRVPISLYQRLKRVASEYGFTMTEIVVEALKEFLSRFELALDSSSESERQTT
jgi:predicted DNA-binding protein